MAGSVDAYVVVLVKLVDENPVLQGEPGAAAPFTRVSAVPVACVATELSAPVVLLVYESIWLYPAPAPVARKNTRQLAKSVNCLIIRVLF
jgi:hypothetical protein